MKYFTIDELCASDVAWARNIPNHPTSEARENLTRLIDRVLDPIREAWGGPVTVTSGFRAQLLNKAVGGVSTSQYLLGEAADITVGSPDLNKRLFDLVVSLQKEGKIAFDQLIWEKGSAAGPDWIHVSYRQGSNRNQILHLN